MRGRKISRASISPKALRSRARPEGTTATRSVRPALNERFVLLVGEEGAVLTHMRRNRLLGRCFSHAPDAPEMSAMQDMVTGAAGVPLYILFDTVDQSYVQQQLPPVTALSIKRLVKRRLDRDFSEDYLKGALLLGREKKGRKDWSFMMVALQKSVTVQNWLAVALEWPVPCRGVLLLPVESAEILVRLRHALRKEADQPRAGDAPTEAPKEKKARGKPKEEPGWHLLVSYNKVSGIRQVVFHNGRLVLTRLSQPALDSSSEMIAGSIEQEVIGTKEYLKRLAYQEKEKLELLILASQDILGNIDIAKLQAGEVHTMTPHRAALLLKLEDAAQSTDRFADSFLCAAAATNKKRPLVLTSDALRRCQTLATVFHMQRAVAAALMLGMLGTSGSDVWDIVTLRGEMKNLKQQETLKQQELDVLRQKHVKPLEELERIIEAVALYDMLAKESVLPHSILMRMRETLGEEVRVATLEWNIKGRQAMSVASPPVTGRPVKDIPQVEATLALEFPKDILADRKRLQQETTDVLNRFKAAFPEHEVRYAALPAYLSDEERIDVNLSEKETKAPQPDTQANIPIRLVVSGYGENEGSHEAAAHP